MHTLRYENKQFSQILLLFSGKYSIIQ